MQEIHFSLDRGSKWPLQQQLAETLRRHIRLGTFPPDSALPAVNELARMAGVSLRTADLALQMLIQDGVCYRRPKKGTFVSANGFSGLRAVCCAWYSQDVLDNQSHPLQFEIYSGFLEVAHSTKMAVSVVVDEPEDTIWRYRSSQRFDFRGLLTLEGSFFDATVRLAQKYPQCHFGFLNIVWDKFDSMPPNMFAVVNDDYLGGRCLVRYHLQNGRRRFVLFSSQSSPHDMVYRERLRGFEDEIRDGGGVVVSRKDFPISALDKDVLFQAENEELTALLDREGAGRQPEVILCVNDVLASGACSLLRSRGLATPLVSGYDGYLPNFYFQNEYACIQVPFREMGRRALQFLAFPSNIPFSRVVKIPPILLVGHRCIPCVSPLATRSAGHKELS